MKENVISYQVIGCCIELHRTLGPGLLESVYQSVLAFELRSLGLQVEEQVPIKIRYKDLEPQTGFRADIIVEDKVLIELKSVESLSSVHFAQTLTYLKLANLKLALLINFNSSRLKDGIHRLVNNL